MWLCGAALASIDDWSTYGLSQHQLNYSYVFCGAIESTIFPDLGSLVGDATVHEIGHQFELPNTDHEEGILNREASDMCVMDYSTNSEIPPCEFCCSSGYGHLEGIRAFADDL